MPIYEVGLSDLVERNVDAGRLMFTDNVAQAIAQGDIIFIAVGTPMGEDGSANLSYIDGVVRMIAENITSYKIIVTKSTVPVGTGKGIRAQLEDVYGIDPNLFSIVSNPEFLREGNAVEDFLHPDRIVVGADGEPAAQLLQEIYNPLTSGDYYSQAGSIPGNCTPLAPPPLLNTSTKSAEIIKHASNAFLAMKISFINAVSNLCEATNANIEQVARGIGLDSRIGPKFLRPGIGYGGSCFPKDVAAFRSVAEQFGVDFSLLAEVEKINARQKRRFVAKVRSALWTLRGKRLGIKICAPPAAISAT